MSELLIKPGVSLGSYPQRNEDSLDDLEGFIHGWIEKGRASLGRRRLSQRSIVGKVNRYQVALQDCTDEAFNVVLAELRSQSAASRIALLLSARRARGGLPLSPAALRSEERRVGKERRPRWSPDQ